MTKVKTCPNCGSPLIDSPIMPDWHCMFPPCEATWTIEEMRELEE